MNLYRLAPLLLTLGVFFTPAHVLAQDLDASTADATTNADVAAVDVAVVVVADDVAVVPVAPVTDENVTENVTLLIRSAKNGQWALFAGFLIMLLIFVMNKAGLKDRIGDAAVPWVGLVLGVLSSIGVMLASGISADEAIISGLVAGLTATGGWELIFKHLLSQPSPPRSGVS